MKCVCGFEVEKNFPNFEVTGTIHHDFEEHSFIRKIMTDKAALVQIFICPECGTLKSDVDELN